MSVTKMIQQIFKKNKTKHKKYNHWGGEGEHSVITWLSMQ